MVSQSDITYRLRGIPDYYGKDEVSQLLAQLLGLDVGAIWVRSLASHPFREREKVATLNLRERPRELENGENEWRFQYSNPHRGDELDIVLDTNFIGITPLHGIPENGCDTCCIALSGLNAHAFGSFKARSDNFMWLRDALPKDMPNSRIYIYGYDTRLIDSLSRKNILDLGSQFAGRLKSLVGGSSSTSTRSLLLIGHSLGGLVLEQALVNLVKNDGVNMEIIRALKGILLFGVPHLGMLNKPLLPMVQGQPNEGLVSCLKMDSDFLELQQEGFATARSKMHNVQVISFYETDETPTVEKDRESQQWRMTGSPTLLVSKSSATKGCDVPIPIDRNHSELVKFRRHDDDLLLVMKQLKELGKPYQQKQATHYSNLSEKEIKALRSLGFSEQHHRRDELNSTNDTCGWLLLNSTFKTWLNPRDQSQRILWIAGNPGTGKSTMMKYIHNVIEQQWHIDYVLFSYFFHGRGTALQRTKMGFLRSILHQFMRRFQDSLRMFLSDYGEKLTQNEEKDIQWTEVELNSILMKVIRAIQLHESMQICLLVDALDESGEETAPEIFNILRNITTDCTKIKIVFSCRWYPIFQRKCNFIAMEKENQADIQTVVSSVLVEEFENDEEINILEKAILQKADGMFQWALLVTRSIVDKHNKKGNSVSALLKIIEELPSDLHELYASLLHNIEVDEKHQTIKLLRWLLFSIRPLTAEELQHALVADEKDMPSSINDFASHDHFVDPVKGIITLSRGLAEIKHHEKQRIAQFIHQSVPDYLLMAGGFGQLIGSTNRRSVVGESHFALSRSCLNYALLPEILEFALARIDDDDDDDNYNDSDDDDDGNDGDDRPVSKSAKRFPLAQYVHDYWVVHIIHVESHNIEQKDLLELLKNREKELSPIGVLTVPPGHSFYGSTAKYSMREIFDEDNARFKDIWGLDLNEQQEKCRKFPLGFENPWEVWGELEPDVAIHMDNAWSDNACANTVILLSLAGVRSALKSIGRQAFAKIPGYCGARQAEKPRILPLSLSLMGNPRLRLEDIPEHLTTEEVNVDPSQSYTPVLLAAMLQREDLVQCFINAGADLDHVCGEDSQYLNSPFGISVYCKNEKIARMLRDAGAELDLEMEVETIKCAWDIDNYRFLLDIGLTAVEFFTSLILDDFTSQGNDVILNLLEAGLDTNAVIEDDLTMFQAALRLDRLSIIDAFVKCPRTKPDLVDAHGRTPLMRIVIWNYRGYLRDLQWTIEFCVDSGRFDLEARDHFGETLLAHATRETKGLIVETLLDAGVEPNPQDVDGQTPLMVAAEYGQTRNLRDLLASDRIDVNLSDNQQWTALCYATVNGKMGCANMLFMSSRIDVEDSRRRLASTWFDCVEQGRGWFLRGFAFLRPQWFYCEVVEQMRSQALRSGNIRVISAVTNIGFIQ